MDFKTAIKKANTFREKFLKSTNNVIVGSLRREKKKIQDIDFIIIDDNLSQISKTLNSKLKKSKSINVLASGDRVVRLEYNNTRIDLFYIKIDELAPALLHFTGSKEFNIKMSVHAKSMGYKLNQYGLFRLSDNKRIKTPTEEDIFKRLKMEYKLPKDRN